MDVFSYHAGNWEEINACLEENLDKHSFSFYFSRKFADFCGLFLGFFSMILLAFLFIRDTKRDTWELLHTKPVNAAVYILPNIFMVACVYTAAALVFKNPIPAVPLLFLYMIYSNMGSRGPDGKYGYYGRPLAIMVRFPGKFFETAPPPLALLNQTFLIIASVLLLLLSIWIWKRRRVY